MVKTVIVTADKIVKRKKAAKITKIVFVSVLSVLAILFMILAIIYNGGRFVISLDPNFAAESGIVIYDSLEDKDFKRKLYADEVNFMDNISINWLPKDIDTAYEGAHNGENYIAYTFYIENQGKKTVNYWYDVEIDDVIKNVDEAVRVMIVRNGVRTVYAKINADTRKEEEGTKAFFSKDFAVLEKRENFEPGNIDKYTVVVWLEGDDPDCINAIIGGEIKMHMDITEEHIEEVIKDEKEEKE